MSKLLSAEFVRLFKSFVFRLCLMFSAILGIFGVLMRWWDIKCNPATYAELDITYRNADGLIFAGGLYLIFVISVFISIFVGTEYSDGTIRNKLTVGHSRRNIYLSKIIVCAVADILIHILYILVVLILAELFINGTTMTMAEIISFTIVSIIAVLAITTILVLLSISNQSKAIGAVVVLLTTFIMFFATLLIGSRLEIPEYSNDKDTINSTETGEIIPDVEKNIKNPRYLRGTKRKVYEFLNDFLPLSQIYQIVLNTHDKQLHLLVIYDFLIMIVTTGAGMFIFQKKNLK